MMQKVKPDYVGEMFVNQSDNYYVINKDSDNSYEILQKIPIEGNEELIKEFTKGWDSYDNGRNSIDENIERLTTRSTNSDRNNVDVETEETWSEYIDRILEESKSKKSDTTRNNSTNNENNTRKLDMFFFFRRK